MKTAQQQPYILHLSNRLTRGEAVTNETKAVTYDTKVVTNETKAVTYDTDLRH